MLKSSLENIIHLCKKNNRAAQKQIYDAYSSVLFSVCLRYANSYEDAQDTFQEGFIIIFNKIDQYNFQGSFEGWMKRIMINLSLEKLRKNPLQESENIELYPAICEEDEEIDFDFEYEKILEIIQDLPHQYRQVFNLYVMENFSHQEIASLLNISVGTSKSNLSRARNILKQKLTLQTNSIENEQI